MDTLFILDKIDYKKKEKEIIDKFKNQNIKIYYTEYEDALIRKVCKWKFIGEILLHILYWIKSYRYARKIYKENGKCKVICINPIVGIFLGMKNRKNKMKITLAGFLFEPKKNKFYYFLRKCIVKLFLKGIDNIVVYSRNEVNYYEKIFKIKKFTFVKYGIDYESHKKYMGELPEKYIFSGGRSNREYHTLIEAYNKVKKMYAIDLCIATRPVVLQNENTTNTIVLKDVVLETFGSAMEFSGFVILPLMEREISAGHQVLLEALERNKIVIVSKIDAVLDYVSDEQVIFYESSNVEDLISKMKEVLDNYNLYKEKYRNNYLFYNENYTFMKFLERLISV